MIKIAYLINEICANSGGTEKQLLLLLQNIDRRKFAPTLCVLRTSEWVEKEFDLCPVHTIGIDSLKSIRAIPAFTAFCRYLAREKYQILQTHFAEAERLGTLAAKISGVEKVISTRRNQWYLNSLRNSIFSKYISMHVDHYVANSYCTADLVKNKEKIPENKVSVIYNALDTSAFRKNDLYARRNYRNALNINDDVLVVGMVANLRKIKGVDVFIRAASKVKKYCPRTLFLIVGSSLGCGSEEDRLRNLVDELNLSETIRFLGQRTDIPQILATFDIAVLTSHSEGFSNSLVEYIASGLPIVTTDVGGAREAVTDGVNGFILPVNDHEGVSRAIINIANGSLDKQALIMKQNESTTKYSYEKMTCAYEKLYTDILWKS